MAGNKAATGGRFFDPVFTAKNTAVGFVLTIAFLFIASWVASLMAMSEDVVRLITGIITYICVGVCGFRAARHNGSNGLVSGAVAGLIYVVILFAVGCLAYAKVNIGKAELLTVLVCILSGAAGGIMGVNTTGGHKKAR